VVFKRNNLITMPSHNIGGGRSDMDEHMNKGGEGGGDLKHSMSSSSGRPQAGSDNHHQHRNHHPPMGGGMYGHPPMHYNGSYHPGNYPHQQYGNNNSSNPHHPDEKSGDADNSSDSKPPQRMGGYNNGPPSHSHYPPSYGYNMPYGAPPYHHPQSYPHYGYGHPVPPGGPGAGHQGHGYHPPMMSGAGYSEPERNRSPGKSKSSSPRSAKGELNRADKSSSNKDDNGKNGSKTAGSPSKVKLLNSSQNSNIGRTAIKNETLSIKTDLDDNEQRTRAVDNASSANKVKMGKNEPDDESHQVEDSLTETPAPMKSDFHFFGSLNIDPMRDASSRIVQKHYNKSSLVKSEDMTEQQQNSGGFNESYLLHSHLNEQLMKKWERKIVVSYKLHDEYLVLEEGDRVRFMNDDFVLGRHCNTLTARSKSPRHANNIPSRSTTITTDIGSDGGSAGLSKDKRSRDEIIKTEDGSAATKEESPGRKRPKSEDPIYDANNSNAEDNDLSLKQENGMNNKWKSDAAMDNAGVDTQANGHYAPKIQPSHTADSGSEGKLDPKNGNYLSSDRRKLYKNVGQATISDLEHSERGTSHEKRTPPIKIKKQEQEPQDKLKNNYSNENNTLHTAPPSCEQDELHGVNDDRSSQDRKFRLDRDDMNGLRRNENLSNGYAVVSSQIHDLPPNFHQQESSLLNRCHDRNSLKAQDDINNFSDTTQEAEDIIPSRQYESE